MTFTLADLRDELASGRWHHTTETLWNSCDPDDGGRLDTYCCLGVACRMAGISNEEIGGSTLPSELRPALRAKFNEAWPQLAGPNNQLVESLYKLNDVSESFAPVVAFIDDLLEGAE